MPPPKGRSTRLRARTTRFVGRAAELSLLDATLEAEALVVVLGPPGVGKTRLAHEHALRQKDAYPGGVFCCDLTDAADADDLCAAISAALDAPLTSAGAGVQQLGDALAARGKALLVLDNLEHMVAAAAPPIAVLREHAPEARLLVTSRERLGLEGEALLDLAPLPVVPAGADGVSEAAQLFVDRARQVVAGYALDPVEAPRVAELARRLDGLPLALELAAARLRVFSVETLLEAMKHRFDVLQQGPRGPQGRHASLRGALETSWRSLDPAEQAALAQCSVFCGGFDLGAAERVVTAGPGAPRMADLLQSLRDHSLLILEDGRFRLLQSIRELGREKLAERGETEAAEARHAAHTLAEGRALARAADGPDQQQARARLALLVPNLLAVHRRALARTPPALDEAGEAALALQPHLCLRGPLGTAARLLDPIADAAPGAVPPALRARALAARADVRRATDDVARCLADSARAQALAAELGDDDTLADALFTAAALSSLHGRRAEVDELLRRLEPLATPATPRRRGRFLALLGVVGIVDGAPARALAPLAEALQLLGEQGDLRYLAITEANVCLASTHLGRIDEARRHGERAVAAHRALGNRRHVIPALTYLSAIALEEGRLDEAVRLIEEAETVSREVGERYYAALMPLELGVVHLTAGRLELAATALARGLAAFQERPNPWVAVAYAWLGALSCKQRQLEEAEARFAEAGRVLAAHPGFGAEAVAEVLRGFLDLAHAAAARAAGDARSADALEAEARRRHEAAAATPLTHVRVARRLLEQALGARMPALVVHPRGDWFRLPSGQRVDCARKRLLPRLLVTLARRRLSAPGAPVATPALVAAGWPGERIAADAAAARLYVAINTLRKLGLREIIRSDAGGYALDPAVHVRFAADDEATSTE